MTKETEKLMKEILEKIDKITSGKTGEYKYSTSIKGERKISRVDYENDTVSVMVTIKSDTVEEGPDWAELEIDIRDFIDKWESEMRARTRRTGSTTSRKKFGGFKAKGKRE